MKYSSDKDVNSFTRRLVMDGWRFKRGKKHGKLLAPCGRGMVVISSTPSKRGELQELMSNVKRIKAIG